MQSEGASAADEVDTGARVGAQFGEAGGLQLGVDLGDRSHGHSPHVEHESHFGNLFSFGAARSRG